MLCYVLVGLWCLDKCMNSMLIKAREMFEACTWYNQNIFEVSYRPIQLKTTMGLMVTQNAI